MTDSPDYRLYLGKCIKDLEDTVSDIKKDRHTLNDKIDTLIQGLSDQMVELKLIKGQTTLTNSRVNHLEEQRDQYLSTRVSQEDVTSVETKVDELGKKVETINENLLEVWFFKKYPKVFIGIITIAVFATLGMTLFTKKDMKEIRTKVNYIEAYEKIPFAPTRGLNAYPDTSNAKR